MAVKHFCDHCGRETKMKRGPIETQVKIGPDATRIRLTITRAIGDGGFNGDDLCEVCFGLALIIFASELYEGFVIAVEHAEPEAADAGDIS